MPPMSDPAAPTADSAASDEGLSVWDAVSLIVGIVVGISIFKVPSAVFSNVSSPLEGFGLWALGGLLSWAGALCYCELAVTYPRTGGEYVYLTQAFGRWAGFLFGWVQLTAILPSNMGVMAFVFGDYSCRALGRSKEEAAWFALASVVVLTCVNLVGLRLEKRVLNLLSVAKMFGLLSLIVAGVYAYCFRSSPPIPEIVSTPTSGGSLGLAMVFILYAFGGWNDAAFVAAEVRDVKRNVPRALRWGIGLITILYLTVNLAYVAGLGWEGVRNSETPASDLLELAGGWGRLFDLLVMLSALGAINGLLFAGSRMVAALGDDHHIFGLLGRHGTHNVPRSAVIALGGIAALLIFTVGTSQGQSSLDSLFQMLRLPSVPWARYHGGFETLLAAFAPTFWTFFALTGLSLFVLRYRDPNRERPFRVPLYPLTPAVFISVCLWMIWRSAQYAEWLSVGGVIAVLLGFPVAAWSFLSRRQ